MSKEHQVEIPIGSGNRYRYSYDPASRATRYLGPVGSAPAINEQEFLRQIEDPSTSVPADEWWENADDDQRYILVMSGPRWIHGKIKAPPWSEREDWITGRKVKVMIGTKEWDDLDPKVQSRIKSLYSEIAEGLSS